MAASSNASPAKMVNSSVLKFWRADDCATTWSMVRIREGASWPSTA
jgi:hypothetical protein